MKLRKSIPIKLADRHVYISATSCHACYLPSAASSVSSVRPLFSVASFSSEPVMIIRSYDYVKNPAIARLYKNQLNHRRMQVVQIRLAWTD